MSLGGEGRVGGAVAIKDLTFDASPNSTPLRTTLHDVDEVVWIEERVG